MIVKHNTHKTTNLHTPFLTIYFMNFIKNYKFSKFFAILRIFNKANRFF